MLRGCSSLQIIHLRGEKVESSLVSKFLLFNLQGKDEVFLKKFGFLLEDRGQNFILE